jgi:hypothetical protein
MDAPLHNSIRRVPVGLKLDAGEKAELRAEDHVIYV